MTMRDDTGNDVVACDHCGEYMTRRKLRESHWAGEGACAEAHRSAEARFRAAMEERRRRSAEARRRRVAHTHTQLA